MTPTLIGLDYAAKQIINGSEQASKLFRKLMATAWLHRPRQRRTRGVIPGSIFRKTPSNRVTSQVFDSHYV